MSKAVVDVLSEAQELIRDPANWCQGAGARSSDGLPCIPDSADACRWCASGAVRALRNNRGLAVFPALTALDRAADALSRPTPETVNDRDGHDVVMRMFDLAIAFAKEAA